MNADPEVQRYIDSIAEVWQRRICERLRALIREAEPAIEERIAWGSPSFYREGQVAWMFCARDWVHFAFPQGVLLEAPEGTWDEGADTASKAKRTIKFERDREVPGDLILDLVRRAVRLNLEGRRYDFGIPKPGSQVFELSAERRELLQGRGLLKAFLARPFYQQNGWFRWIEEAKTEATREKRIGLMFDDLATGRYMPPLASARL